MKLFAITPGRGSLSGIGALPAGVELIVREATIPDGVDPTRMILHARMPGALERARHGLHLSSDMDVAWWRIRFAGQLSVSTHARAQALDALDAGADYAFLSPIYEARHGREALGLGDLEGLVALGGVTMDKLGELRAAGAVGAAMMGAFFRS